MGKCEGMFVPVHAMQTYRGSGSRMPIILISALDGDEWSASCSGHLTLWERAMVPLKRRLGVAPEPARTLQKIEKFLVPAGIIQPHSLVTILTQLLKTRS